MEQLTQTEKIHLGTKEIAKRIRQQLKDEFKNCVFSVVQERGNSIHVSLMKSDIMVVKPFEELSATAISRYADEYRTPEKLKEIQESKHHQLSQVIGDYNPDLWNNGVFLTEGGHALLKRVVEIVNQYNYDNSDPMTDYFDTNFYLDLSLGKWDKPFVDGVQ